MTIVDSSRAKGPPCDRRGPKTDVVVGLDVQCLDDPMVLCDACVAVAVAIVNDHQKSLVGPLP